MIKRRVMIKVDLRLVKRSILRCKTFLLIVGLITLITEDTFGQIEDRAVKILDEAIGFIVDGGSGAIYYESVATNLQDPLSIFNIPLYKIEKGGYWLFDGDKFEMQAAGMKALSDGKLLSLIDESSKIMYIDSVRKGALLSTDQEVPTFEGLLDNEFGAGNATFIGEEDVNGRSCYKIKAYMEKMASNYILYWVDVKRKQLVLMAEYSGESFTVYEVKKVTTAPKNHNYTMVLPKEEMTEYYGYQVIDMRYSNQFLHPTKGE